MKPTAISSKVEYSSGYASPARTTERPYQRGPDALTYNHPHNRRPAPPIHLTPRQMEVFQLLCEGLPNKLISRQLNIAKGTVKVHVSFILKQFGVSSRLQAVVAAQRCGLLE